MNTDRLLGGSYVITIIFAIITLVLTMLWLILPLIIWAKLSSIDYTSKRILQELERRNVQRQMDPNNPFK
jgi:hypothetical protein